jgi:pimeloyl-ACP methyl ester carboxylesterase
MANQHIIFIHGMESSGHGFKGNLFRERIPGIITPDFYSYSPGMSYQELLERRMEELNTLLQKQDEWKIIGSSFGGLMAALYSLKKPHKVEKLVLLAPMLAIPELKPSKYKTIDIPVVVYHGRNDNVIPIKPTKKRAHALFKNVEYNVVDDNHMLHPTTESIEWRELLELEK